MLFFFISGYLHRDRGIKESLLNLFRSLLIPYFCLSFLSVFIYTGELKLLLNGDMVFIRDTLYRILMGKSLWFVSCLVCVRLLFILLQKVFEAIKMWKSFVILVISIFSILFVFIVHEHPANNASFWYWTTSLYSLGFYIWGYYCRIISLEKKLPQVKKYYGIILILGYSMISYITQSYFDVEFHVYTDSFKSPIVFIFLAILGIICVCYSSILICNYKCLCNKYIVALGQNSLLLFAINGKVRLTLEKGLFVYGADKISELIYIFFICIIQGLVILFIGYFINKYIPWIVGKHK